MRCFTQAAAPHAEMRPARFVVDPRLLAIDLPCLAIQGWRGDKCELAALRVWKCVLTVVMHECDRFAFVAARNIKPTYCKFQANRAGQGVDEVPGLYAMETIASTQPMQSSTLFL